MFGCGIWGSEASTLPSAKGGRQLNILNQQKYLMAMGHGFR